MAMRAAEVGRRVAREKPAPRPRPRVVPAPEPAAGRPGRIRRVLAGLLVVAVAVGIDAGWRWLSSAELFPLEAVELEGTLEHVSERDLRLALDGHANRGMLAMDVAAIRAALEALAWVEKATVRRRWPGTLELTIVEQVAQARWNRNGLLNPAGEVFEPEPDSFPGGLPELAGPAGSERRVMERFHALDALLAPLELKVTAVTMDERHAWRALVNDEIEMQLGADEGNAAVERFVRTYPRLAAGAEGRLSAVDLRYPNGFALKWGQVKAGAEGKDQ